MQTKTKIYFRVSEVLAAAYPEFDSFSYAVKKSIIVKFKKLLFGEIYYKQYYRSYYGSEKHPLAKTHLNVRHLELIREKYGVRPEINNGIKWVKC